MKVDSAAVTGSINPKVKTNADDIDRERKLKEQSNPLEMQEKSSIVQPEEILDQIKALTDNGAYSVRFEKDSQNDQLVLRLVDVESGETIRQLPPEEIISLTETLKELRGNVLDITG